MCVGTAPTFTGDSISSVSCTNTAGASVSSPCGSSGYSLVLFRDTAGAPVAGGSGNIIYSVSIPDGPGTFSGSHDDAPPCYTGNYSYQWAIMCGSATQSVGTIRTAASGGSPSLSLDQISSSNCDNTLSITTTLLCGTCGGSVKLYRNQGSSPSLISGEVIYTDTISAGPATHHSSYVDTPPCVRGAYFYQWQIELPSGNTTGVVHEATSGGEASISATTLSADANCEVTTTCQIEKPCGECIGSIKCYRSAEGGAVTFAPGEIIFSDIVPQGPLIGLTFTATDSPGDGIYEYAWQILSDAAGVDDSHSAGHQELRCNLALYNPYTTALPVGQMEKQIVLVNVTRGTGRGYEYTDIRVLNLQEQRAEWWIHKNGGCGAFRFLTHDLMEEIVDDDSTTDSWELHVRIKLAGEYTYTTWYRGIIRSVKIEEQGAEQFCDIRGYGYVELLDNVQVQREYPAGMTVQQVVNDIIDVYIKPGTRIRRPSDIDVTNGDSGVDASPYVLASPVHFEISALKALKFLAELQGNREFGVDADGFIYFRQSISTIIYNFFLSKDIVKKISGGKTFIQANELKVAGKSFGARDFLKVRPDVTDISWQGVYESAVEVPWVTGDKDASTWADNVIAKNKARQEWSVFTWKGVTRRLDSDNPIGKIALYGDDISNNRDVYDIAKIQYVEGGWMTKQELREMGSPSIQPELDQQLLKATFYVGYYPRDLVEEIEIRLREQIEFLKGRHKQYRYPNDVTNSSILASGKIPGEIKHYHDANPDVTNLDLINNSTNLADITNPRGVLASWIGNQWTKLSLRRTFRDLTGVVGLYIGEIATLITDPTNAAFGTVVVWSGSAWSLVGADSGAGNLVEGALITRETGVDGAVDFAVTDTPTEVEFVTIQSNDNGVADLVADNTLLTAQSNGPCVIKGRVKFKAGSSGSYHKLELLLVNTGQILDIDIRDDSLSNGQEHSCEVSASAYMLEGFQVQLLASTDSTDDSNLIEFASFSLFSIGSVGIASTAVGSPTGPAGGMLYGNYPSPDIADDVITDQFINSANKDGADATPCMRTLGYGAGQAVPGNTELLEVADDSHNGLVPQSTPDPNEFLVGTSPVSWKRGFDPYKIHSFFNPETDVFFPNLGGSAAAISNWTTPMFIGAGIKVSRAQTSGSSGSQAGYTPGGAGAFYGLSRQPGHYSTVITGPNLSDLRMFIGCGQGDTVAAQGAVGGSSIGFFYGSDTTSGAGYWQIRVSVDNSHDRVHVTTTPIAVDTLYKLHWDATNWLVDGAIRFYIDDVLVYTHTTAAEQPIGLGMDNDMTIKALAAAVKILYVSTIHVEED